MLDRKQYQYKIKFTNLWEGCVTSLLSVQHGCGCDKKKIAIISDSILDYVAPD
jgi:hypothetical protein